MIVRINDVGHAEAIDYRNFQYRPQEAKTNMTSPAGPNCISAAIASDRNSIQNDIKDSALPYLLKKQSDCVGSRCPRVPGRSLRADVDVEIKNVIHDDLRQSLYLARIEFEKVYTNPADHSEVKRVRWTASVTYVFRENVKNNELAVNPLGLTIVRFRADQAFS
jgi:type IV secretion system protein VirB5